jgi:hypothetical protein
MIMFTARIGVFMASIFAAGATIASSLYQPVGPDVTYGEVTHGQRVLLGGVNPASGAASQRLHEDGRARSGTMLSLGAGIEYGNVDELFDLIDKVSAAIKPSDPDSGEPPPPGQNPGDKPPGGIELPDFGGTIDPELEEIIRSVGRQIVSLSAVLAVIAVEGYAKANANGNIPLVIGKEMLGGAWSFDINVSGTAKAAGFAEEIEFDFETALAEFIAAYDLKPGDPATAFDLSGGLLLTVDPNQDSVRLALENDSLLLTKSATVTDVGLTYSRQATARKSGTLFWGAKAKYYNMRLSRLSTRFGDITDADELFESIRNADYRNDNGYGLDLGLLWVAKNYQLGATITNINEPSFEFPLVDTSDYTNANAINLLRQDTRYTMERKLKLEGSLFSSSRRWNVNLGLDANAGRDVMSDDYQWATISAAYATDSWWLPGIRTGLRKNLAGTELTYVGVGLTAFKIVNFDVASTLETVKISGTSLPTGLMASIGFEITF